MASNAALMTESFLEKVAVIIVYRMSKSHNDSTLFPLAAQLQRSVFFQKFSYFSKSNLPSENDVIEKI